jgi:hypothetical protein
MSRFLCSLLLLITYICEINGYLKVNNRIQPKLKMSNDINKIIKESIRIFNVIDIIKPNSLSMITFYNLFYHNFLRIMSKSIDINVNMMQNVVILSIIYSLYINNKMKINKLLNPLNNESTCINIFINFIIYWLFKDVLNVY